MGFGDSEFCKKNSCIAPDTVSGASCPYGQTPDVQTCSCLDSLYGPETNSTVSSAPTYSGAPDDTSSDITSAAAEPTPTDVDSASAAPPVETAASDSASDVASSTSAAADAAATDGLSGNVNDPNGR